MSSTESATVQDEIRRQVRAVLDRTPAYQALPTERRRAMAQGMVDVLGYLADPSGGTSTQATAAEGARHRQDVARALGAPLATGQEDPPKRAYEEAGPQAPTQPVNKGVTGDAARIGAETMASLVEDVDFPGFVSGLIDGVFTSIVDSSIKQMEAYADLLSAVTKSVDQFASENITDGQARDHIRRLYPGAVRIDATRDGSRLRLRRGLDDDQRPDFSTMLGGEPGTDTDLDDEDSERELVRQAKLKMARSRQQQLATMVVLGINRIVVTNGKINAKVVFDVKTEETAQYKASAEYHDRKLDIHRHSRSSKNIWGTRRSSSSNVRARVQTLDSNTKQQNDSSIEAKAKLTGEVSVNFKSETFPLEKLASPDQMLSIQSLSDNPGGAR